VRAMTAANLASKNDRVSDCGIASENVHAHSQRHCHSRVYVTATCPWSLRRHASECSGLDYIRYSCREGIGTFTEFCFTLLLLRFCSSDTSASMPEATGCRENSYGFRVQVLNFQLKFRSCGSVNEIVSCVDEEVIVCVCFAGWPRCQTKHYTVHW